MSFVFLSLSPSTTASITIAYTCTFLFFIHSILPSPLSFLFISLFLIILPSLSLSLFTVSMDSSLSLLSNSLYMSIAQYIPHLLRQWYLTLDRQTSNLISRYNMISQHDMYMYISMCTCM